MKKKFVVSIMLVSLSTLNAVFISCSNGANPDSGGTIPEGPDAITVAFSPPSKIMGIGETWKPDVLAAPDNAPLIKWESDNSAVATVANDGTIAAKSFGKAKITVTAKGGKTASCAVTINPVLIRANDSALNGLRLASIVFDGAKFVAGINHADGAVATASVYHSADCVDWTKEADDPLLSNGGSKRAIAAIAFGNGAYIMGGGSNDTCISVSTDGTTWIPVNTASLVSFSKVTSIAYGNGMFVAGSSYGRIAWSDDNGATWTEADNGQVLTNGVNEIIYANGKFVAAGDASNQQRIAYSTDGKNWTLVTMPFDSYKCFTVAYGGEKYLAGFDNSSSAANLAWSTDLETWTPVSFANSFNDPFFVGYPGRIVYTHGNFFAADAQFAGLAYSSDGLSWVEMARNIDDEKIVAMAFGKGKLVLLGAKSQIRYINLE
jgi:hypothetical protein